MDPVPPPGVTLESGLTFESMPSSSGTAYSVKLPIFEGPLDLLLHLIRINEVDVTDIPIATIAKQYLEYLELLIELDLDLAGEYLVMAATLAWIKSRSLLPPDAEDEEGEGIDPRAELVTRLREYQRFKEAAGELGERQLLGRDVFRPAIAESESSPEDEREIEVGLPELLEALRRALIDRPGRPGVHEVSVETITVRERMIAVMELLESQESAEFQLLLQRSDGATVTRAFIVATFLAILELARLSAIRLYQGVSTSGAPEGPLRIRRPDGVEVGWHENVSDLL